MKGKHVCQQRNLDQTKPDGTGLNLDGVAFWVAGWMSMFILYQKKPHNCVPSQGERRHSPLHSGKTARGRRRWSLSLISCSRLHGTTTAPCWWHGASIRLASFMVLLWCVCVCVCGKNDVRNSIQSAFEWWKWRQTFGPFRSNGASFVRARKKWLHDRLDP